MTEPSEVRTKVLLDHARLRGLLARAGEAAEAALSDAAAMEALRAVAGELSSEMALHLAMEEELLVPVLAAIDAWGGVRVRHMREEHERQLAELRRLSEAARGPYVDRRDLARDVRHFVADLYRDMRQEERDLLHPDLLRDDPISIDQTDG